MLRNHRRNPMHRLRPSPLLNEVLSLNAQEFAAREVSHA